MASPHAGPTGDQPSSFQEVIAPYVKAHTHELSTHRPVYDDAGHSAAAAQARAHEHGLEHTPEPEPKHMPEGYSYMCPGLFAPARVDDPAVKLRDTGAKVYYLTRRPEAISPAQDAQLRSTDGLFCRFFNEEEEDYDPSSKEALDEPAPLAFFPWQVCHGSPPPPPRFCTRTSMSLVRRTGTCPAGREPRAWFHQR